MSNELAKPAKNESKSVVLIVDDEAPVRLLLRRWLDAAGYECLEASSVTAAFQVLGRSQVNVVTSDIRMPEVTGMDLLRRLRREYPDVAAVMLTGVGETVTAIESLTSGASGYLIKPVAREELLFQVNRALERQRLVLENRRYTHELEELVRERTANLRRAHEETIHRLLTASLLRDEETGAHIKRTGLYCEALAAAAGWSGEQVEAIRMAAPMHDVGKIGIPDSILRKPGKLTPQEYEIMKSHVEVGAQVLASSDWPVLTLAHEIALCHHERWDGSGYPAGLAGHSIPESARMLSIADVFDALSHDRVYRPALPDEEVEAILKQGRGSHFDPHLLDLFLEILPEMRRISSENPDVPLECVTS